MQWDTVNSMVDPRIQDLQEQAGESGELNYIVGEAYFKINLRDENIALWQETFEQNKSSDNLLLACEKNTGDLITTKLTWVVGSAIRGTTANDAAEAGKLLTHMGVVEELAKAAVEYCPGLGEDLVWSFYLERHGWLIATPVAQSKRQHTR